LELDDDVPWDQAAREEAGVTNADDEVLVAELTSTSTSCTSSTSSCASASGSSCRFLVPLVLALTLGFFVNVLLLFLTMILAAALP
jgi:hypothetical protein